MLYSENASVRQIKLLFEPGPNAIIAILYAKVTCSNLAELHKAAFIYEVNSPTTCSYLPPTPTI